MGGACTTPQWDLASWEEGMPLPCKLNKVHTTLINTGIIIFESQKVSSYFAARRGQSCAAPSQDYVNKQTDGSNLDFIITQAIAANGARAIGDCMMKLLVTNSSNESTPDSLMSALDFALASINYRDIVPADYTLHDNVVLHVNWPARASSSLSRARSRSF